MYLTTHDAKRFCRTTVLCTGPVGVRGDVGRSSRGVDAKADCAIWQPPKDAVG